MHLYLHQRLFISVLLLIITGCSSAPETKPQPETRLNLTIDAGFDINPTRLDKAAPTQIRLYELNSPVLFEKADFLDIYLQDTAVLQDSMIQKHPLPTIQPGARTTLTFTLDNATRYIAILAELADYGAAVPSVVYPIAPETDNFVTLHINGNHLRLSTDTNNLPSAKAEDGS